MHWISNDFNQEIACLSQTVSEGLWNTKFRATIYDLHNCSETIETNLQQLIHEWHQSEIFRLDTTYNNNEIPIAI